MNKYRDKSDFEINKAVAVARCYKVMSCEESVMAYIDSGYKPFDPCNNPADAMPIVIENGISLISDWNEIGVWGATYQPWWTSENKNPLRAAMEVFLMIKDAENEKV
ncbi:phage protein NinX family protein [Morganella morganii]|uniref:phage protein NinX family protein n=1 Tax=Morganella morganii TaxID=582 RepID=UPI0037525B91